MATKSKNPLTRHLSKECGCSIESNPENCIYQQFLDGWNFVPDVGNGQKRGEIFTPRFIVDKMIVDSGMLPKESVYNYDYSGEAEEQLTRIGARIIEPAIGTGNYTSTILWHKIHHAAAYATTDEGLNKDTFHTMMLTSIASVYAYDIDPGNIEISRRRLLDGDTSSVTETMESWKAEIAANLDPDTEYTEESLTSMVADSLQEAEENWAPHLGNTGVITSCYEKITGEKLPEDLKEKASDIIRHNVILFNGLQREDSSSVLLVLPGWKNVYWRWWSIESVDDIGYESVSMNNQIASSQIEECTRRMDDLTRDHWVDEGKGKWDSAENKKKYAALRKELTAAEKNLLP